MPKQPRVYCAATRKDASPCGSVRVIGSWCSHHARVALAALELCPDCRELLAAAGFVPTPQGVK